jgi:hypothetical protein
MRVLEKAGYVREGILRASSVKYGQPRDQAIYARVNPHWRGVERGTALGADSVATRGQRGQA